MNIKTALVERDEIPILIFDEIDTNIGGQIATMVGMKIKNIVNLLWNQPCHENLVF